MATFEIKQLGVRTDERSVVKDVTLKVRSGEIHVLMGPNGSGKTTLVNAIMGHPNYEVTTGEIMLDGENITDLSADKKARLGLFLSMQYLPEIPGVTMTNFLHRAYRELKGSDISVLDFYKHLEEKAKSLDIDSSFLSRHVNSGFSGGEKKQSEILQMVTLEPKFAFLDEIDSGVDVDSMKKVLSGIKKLRGLGVGFILITHYDHILEEISPDHVHVMHGGQIIASGGRELAKEIESKGFAHLIKQTK